MIESGDLKMPAPQTLRQEICSLVGAVPNLPADDTLAQNIARRRAERRMLARYASQSPAMMARLAMGEAVDALLSDRREDD